MAEGRGTVRGLCLPAPRSPEGLLSRPWLWGHSRPWTTCSSSRRRWAARAGGRVRAVAEGPPPSAAPGRSASPGGWADVARPPWCWAGQQSCRPPSRCCLISQQFKKEKIFFLNTSSSFAELPHFHPRHSIGRSFRDGGDLWPLARGAFVLAGALGHAGLADNHGANDCPKRTSFQAAAPIIQLRLGRE